MTTHKHTRQPHNGPPWGQQHTHTYTLTYTHTHAHIHTHTHTHVCACVELVSFRCCSSCHTHAHIHTCACVTHVHVSHICICAHTDVHECRYLFSCTVATMRKLTKAGLQRDERGCWQPLYAGIHTWYERGCFYFYFLHTYMRWEGLLLFENSSTCIHTW